MSLKKKIVMYDENGVYVHTYADITVCALSVFSARPSGLRSALRKTDGVCPFKGLFFRESTGDKTTDRADIVTADYLPPYRYAYYDNYGRLIDKYRDTLAAKGHTGATTKVLNNSNRWLRINTTKEKDIPPFIDPLPAYKEVLRPVAVLSERTSPVRECFSTVRELTDSLDKYMSDAQVLMRVIQGTPYQGRYFVWA